MPAKLAIVISLDRYERLVEEFVNGCDASADINSSDAIKHRLFMGQFLIWLRGRLRDEHPTNYPVPETKGTVN